jgi:hypothetical protein
VPLSTRSEPASVPAGAPWRPATRVGFRFCFLYFGLYSLATQIAGGLLLVPGFSFPGLGTWWPMRQITEWVAARLFRVTSPLVYTGNSGDTNFFWVQTFWLLMAAIAGTIVWSALDRREAYTTLHKWFRVALRLALASQMFEYGMAKVIPTQFPAPALLTLVEPVGNLSLTGLLWTTIGASRGYEVFTGVAEVVAAILLLAPRTTLLGAVICLADMIQVFVLNLTYDIGLKLISFHLTLITLLVLAPELPRLARVFVLDRPAGPSTERELFFSRRANRVALAAQLLFGVYLWGMHTSSSLAYWYGDGGGSARSPLYGIWEVEQLSVNGQLRLPAMNDYDRRWRRVIFDVPHMVVVQRTDDSFARYGASVDEGARRLALTKGGSRSWQASFAFERPAADRLILDGNMDGHTIHASLRLVELDSFRLLNSRFRWIRPPDLTLN